MAAALASHSCGVPVETSFFVQAALHVQNLVVLSLFMFLERSPLKMEVDIFVAILARGSEAGGDSVHFFEEVLRGRV